jgi:FecR protein
VEKIVGDVTIVRNGVSVALHVGDAFKSDVIVTGANSSAGITFPDGTLLDLVANSRMALNEYSFEPNGTDNNALFTLVEGTFGFVAGQVAHDNHMSLVTPVATMGIRGTAGIARFELTSNAGNLVYSYTVLDEAGILHHGHHVGVIELRDNRPESPTYREILGLANDSDYVTYVEPQGPGLPPIVRIEPITTSQLLNDRPILQDLADSYAQFNGPGGIHGQGGSGDNPNGLFGPELFEQNNNGLPFTFNFQGGGLSGGTATVASEQLSVLSRASRRPL